MAKPRKNSTARTVWDLFHHMNCDYGGSGATTPGRVWLKNGAYWQDGGNIGLNALLVRAIRSELPQASPVKLLRLYREVESAIEEARNA